MRKISIQQQVGSQIVLVLIGLYVILPIWGIIRLAFDGTLLARPTEFRWLPKVFSMDAFFKVLDRPYQSVNFISLLQNSLLVSVGSAMISILLGASLAYAFARFRFPGRAPGLFLLLLTSLLPPIAFMTPLYIVLTMLNIRTTLFGVIIVYAAFSMPFCIWNMRSTFQAIPKELEEAAFLDGAGTLATFYFITLPLALPSIVVAALIAFLMAYSEFAIGWLFVEKPNTVTLAMSIYAMINSGSAQPWSYLGSLILIMSAPVVAIIMLLQRTLLDRMMFGFDGD
jgi:ABC-type glycerol-3-phosphate transport system permease component